VILVVQSVAGECNDGGDDDACGARRDVSTGGGRPIAWDALLTEEGQASKTQVEMVNTLKGERDALKEEVEDGVDEGDVKVQNKNGGFNHQLERPQEGVVREFSDGEP
jgi:hypothetical protein